MARIYITRGSTQPKKLTKLPLTFVNPRLTRPQRRYLSWMYLGHTLVDMPGRSNAGREVQILTTLTRKGLIETRSNGSYHLTPLGKQVAGQLR